jgi:hypothetical protein
MRYILSALLFLTLTMPVQAGKLDVWYGQITDIEVPPTGVYEETRGIIPTGTHRDGTQIVGWRLWVNPTAGTTCYMHLRNGMGVGKSWDATPYAPDAPVVLPAGDYMPLKVPLSLQVYCRNTSGQVQHTNASAWIWYRE